jgi:hypothetical protein
VAYGATWAARGPLTAVSPRPCAGVENVWWSPLRQPRAEATVLDVEPHSIAARPVWSFIRVARRFLTDSPEPHRRGRLTERPRHLFKLETDPCERGVEGTKAV